MSLPKTHVIDAYGSAAQSLLRPLQADLGVLAREVTERFYGFISDQGKTQEIIRRLPANDFARLKQKQARYLSMLMSDTLTYPEHLAAAEQVGRAHAFTDVEIRWIVEGYGFYQDEIHNLLSKRVPDSKTREAVIRVISQRFLQDIEGQVSSHKKIATEVATAFFRIDQEVTSAGNLTDLIRRALQIIATLPGDVSVFFARVDELGELQIEQSHGEAAERYHRAMENGIIPKFSVDPTIPSGRGPGGRSYRSGEITVSDAWLLESDKKPWHEVGGALGFRSSASVPLVDDSGHSIALLSIYGGWPGLFSTESVRGLLNHIQQVLSHGLQQRRSAPVVPLREQQAYRQLLTDERVVMHYQPVINLRDGRLVKVEGLARMCGPGGELISPQRFLPALGHDELLKLFAQGMKLICRDLRTLQSRGIDTKIAINLPAEGLDDFRYERSFFQSLNESGLAADRFQVEVLETQDAGEKTPLHIGLIRRLQAAGVQIAQDDLGSGHSSLLRLDQYPFDEVKIDQGLVRGALRNPKRAIEFILYLTRLAHAFNTRVTVEGLENMGMIEAAAILGADYGQGYGIAKPMPVDQLPAWHSNYEYSVGPATPKTAIGAMAGYVLWDMQLATISERPELATEFVGAKAIIEQFIKANKLWQSPICRLLTRNQQLIASNSGGTEAAVLVRDQLINELTDYWFHEAGTLA